MPHNPSWPRLRRRASSAVSTSFPRPTMSSLPTIMLTGNSFGNEKTLVEFHATGTRPDGIDAVLCVKVLEFTFRVETFFYGFNIKSFIEQADAVGDGRSTVAKLFNYEERLTLEFIRLGDNQDFVSIRYTSIAPDSPDERSLESLRRLSTFHPVDERGSHFVLSFMKLDTGLADCAGRFGDMLARLNIATSNPYTESV